MRDYSKTAPTFWTGETGRKIRAAGRDAQVVSFYLFTCPNSNWIGLYYLPLPTLCHEIGISKEGALKALQRLAEVDYAYYDRENEIVWVPGSARFQIGESLKPGDKRIIGIVKDLQSYGKTQFAYDFYNRYSSLYHLPEMQWSEHLNKPLASPLQAPSKPVTVTEAVAVTESEDTKAVYDDVFKTFNSTPGVKPARRLHEKRKTHLRARLQESDWPWKEALSKFPLQCFQSNKWKPTFDWFIRPGKVDEILEGKFDWSPDVKPEAKPTPRLADDYDKTHYNPCARG